MRKRNRFYRQRAVSPILALTLALHLGVMAFKISLDSAADKKKVEKDYINVTLVDKSTMPRQIVQSENPATEAPPTEARYLSDRDRAFDRETRARKVDRFNQASQGSSEIAANEKPSRPSPSKAAPPMGKDIKLSDLGAMAGEQHPFKNAAKKFAQAKQGTKAGRNTASGVSSSNDYVLDVPLGDLTQLNTKEYKYYGFYHRIRQQLEQFWGRSIQEKAAGLVEDGRHLAASEDYVTSVQVTLNRQGKIIQVKIIGSSGVKELDDAAIESFNEAGPFPNPPRDLVVNGHVTLEWGFVVRG